VRILLVEPYFGGSHRAWAEGYARHSRHAVTLLTLPARFWKWRMQGGATILARRFAARDFEPDLILASDMLNVPAFLGLARERLVDVPVALYFHENQLTYPLRPGEKRDLTYAIINWRSMLAADHVFFNSAYHRGAWFEELPRLLKHFPDHTHTHLVPEARARSSVLPVGCDLARLDDVRPKPPAGEGRPPLLLWNHRWEYDKDPETFFRALDRLVEEGVEFEVALAGSNVRQKPREFAAARKRLGRRVVHYGRADAATYVRLLWEADVVASTALHEFFGVAVVEAIYCRSFPVLPHRLSYPELVPAEFRDRCLYVGFDGLVDGLRWALTHTTRARAISADLREAVSRFDWAHLAPRYDALLRKSITD
jgi:glycosyltransferase involved in cell wall biosynthesis